MHQIHCSDLWEKIVKLSKKAKQKRAAIAYVTSDEHIWFGEGDLLITDASIRAIRNGHTSAQVLKRAIERGAEVRSLPNLHAKVYIMGGHAIIGSANLSASSANQLVEAALVSDHPSVVGMAHSLISQLEGAATRLDDPMLERLLKIQVKKLPISRAPKSKTFKPTISIPRTWLIGVEVVSKDAFSKEAKLIEIGFGEANEKVGSNSNEFEWVRVPRSSRLYDEAMEGDLLICMNRKERSPKISRVYRHCPIIHKQLEQGWCRFYHENPESREKSSITWSQFQKLAAKVGLPKNLGPSSTRQLPIEQSEELFAAWPK